MARGVFAALGMGLLIMAVTYGVLTDSPVPVPAVMAMGVVSLAVWYLMTRLAR